jgi:hypothetical protein
MNIQAMAQSQKKSVSDGAKAARHTRRIGGAKSPIDTEAGVLAIDPVIDSFRAPLYRGPEV